MQKTDIDLITHEAPSGPLGYLWYLSCSEHVALDKSMPIAIESITGGPKLLKTFLLLS